MLELWLSLAFCAALLLCVVLGRSVLWALAAGLLLFFCYGLRRTRSVRAVLRMSWEGVKRVRSILLTFFFIGALTAAWRAAGTVPYIVYHAAGISSPALFPFFSFLICALVSVLFGTSLGTGATVGAICMSTANGMGLPPLLLGGAVLSGCYFGDRCSPMSTSALLVAELTGTDIYQNLREMVRTALLPFLLSCGIYLASGLFPDAAPGASSLRALFAQHFHLHPVMLLPAGLVVVLSCFRCPVRWTMGLSALAASILAVAVQGMEVPTLLETLLLGYRPEDPALVSLAGGGGAVSMVKVFFIVLISSSFSGIFQGTGFLDGFQEGLLRLARRTSPYAAVLATSVLTNLVACNQSLATMLTVQLCGPLEKEPSRMASYLENSSIVVAPLVPWSVACSATLAAASAPGASGLAACYLYLIPAWTLYTEHRRHARAKTV